MFDPIGVAGTAVGIVSLGIQVLQGLMKYVQAVKGSKEEIEEIIQEVQRVVSLFYNLNNVLPEVNSRKCTQSLHNSLGSCYTKLEKLQDFLNGLKLPQLSTSASTTIRNTTRSIIYPFQQAKLYSLHQSLRKDLGDLRLAVEILSMEFTITIREEVQLISQDIKTNSTYQRDHLQALRTQVQQNYNQLDSLRSIVSGAFETIRDQLHQTQLIIHDHDQRVRGRLKVMERNLSNAIANDSGITVAKIEEIKQRLAAQSESIANMVKHS
ncbi:hypothetical protein FSST1_009722 [Fusarium sambucinum]